MVNILGKIILIDINVLMFKAIHNYARLLEQKIQSKSQQFICLPHYTCFTMILSALKKIGIDSDTKTLICQDGHSWRKDINFLYKAQRKEQREKQKLINWDEQFKNFNKMFAQLNEATDWYFVREWKNSEADDIISTAVRLFKDDECIIVSIDADLKMLTYYPNVKYFTLMKKCKGTNGCYEFVDNPLKIRADKIRNGDVSDNIIPDKLNDTIEDVILREKLVDLLNLPDFVEKPIIEILSNLPKKELHLDKLPFKNSKEKFLQIYDPKYKIEPDYCHSLLNKRKERKKK